MKATFSKQFSWNYGGKNPVNALADESNID